MKKTIKTILFAVSAALTLSCAKIDPAAELAGQPVMCRFYIEPQGVSGTKAVGLESDETGTEVEKTIHNMQVFIFGPDGGLITSDIVENSKSISMTVNSGTGYSFYVICNENNLRGDVSSVSDIKSIVSTILGTDKGSTRFVMQGCLENQTVSSESKDFKIQVERRVAKIVLRKVTNSLPPAMGKISIDGIYLANVMVSSPMFTENLDSGMQRWCNKLGDFTKLSDFDWLNEKYPTPLAVSRIEAYETAHTFYAAANPTETDVNGGEIFSPRFTRLVLKATIGGKPYFYPLTFKKELPEITPNSFIDITNLTIKHLGSQSPDIPISTDKVTVTVDVKKWDYVEKEVEL